MGRFHIDDKFQIEEQPVVKRWNKAPVVYASWNRLQDKPIALQLHSLRPTFLWQQLPTLKCEALQFISLKVEIDDSLPEPFLEDTFHRCLFQVRRSHHQNIQEPNELLSEFLATGGLRRHQSDTDVLALEPTL